MPTNSNVPYSSLLDAVGTLPETSPAPIASGYGGGNHLSGIASEFAKLMVADSKRKLASQLQSNEDLADQFDALWKDPRYSPKIQTDAHTHAMNIRLALSQNPAKKLPKQYQYDEKAGGVPEMMKLLYRHLEEETKKRGEIPPPQDPQQPPEVPPPPFMGAPMAGTQLDRQAGPQPGGRKLGPNAITPGPAIGPVPTSTPTPAPTPAAAAVPNVPDVPAAAAGAAYNDPYSGMVPTMMSPAEMIAQANAIPASVAPALATAMGIDPNDPNAMIDLRALQRGGSVLNNRQKIISDLAKHNLVPTFDENGNYNGTRPMRPEEMDPASRAKIEHYGALDAIARTRQALTEAQTRLTDLKSKGLTPGTPQWDLNERKTKVLETMANARMRAVDIAGSGFDLRRQQFDRDTWGTVNGQPVAGALVDPATGKTIGLKTPLSRMQMPTVLALNKADQGRIIIEQGNTLIKDIQAHQDELGAWDGRVNLAAVDLGIADPVVRDLYTRLKSYAALQPQLHGARGVQYQKEFEDAIGHLKDNPQSLVASINALNSLGGDFVRNVTERQTAHSGDNQADLDFINKAMQVRNPKTGKNFTEKEARQELNKRKATAGK